MLSFRFVLRCVILEEQSQGIRGEENVSETEWSIAQCPSNIVLSTNEHWMAQRTMNVMLRWLWSTRCDKFCNRAPLFSRVGEIRTQTFPFLPVSCVRNVKCTSTPEFFWHPHIKSDVARVGAKHFAHHANEPFVMGLWFAVTDCWFSCGMHVSYHQAHLHDHSTSHASETRIQEVFVTSFKLCSLRSVCSASMSSVPDAAVDAFRAKDFQTVYQIVKEELSTSPNQSRISLVVRTCVPRCGC